MLPATIATSAAHEANVKVGRLLNGSLASAEARLASIGRLNDRCRHGLDRTARIMVTRSCLGTFASGDGAMEIVIQARLYAAIRHHVLADADAAERDRGNFEFEGRRSTSRSTITTLRFGSDRRIPPMPASPGVC